MPESKGRAKASYTPPPRKSKVQVGNPPWFVPLMCGFFILGLLWIVTFYVTQGAYPIPGVGSGTSPSGSDCSWPASS